MASEPTVDHPVEDTSLKRQTPDVTEYLKKRMSTDATHHRGLSNGQPLDVTPGHNVNRSSQSNGADHHHQWPAQQVDLQEASQNHEHEPASHVSTYPDTAGSPQYQNSTPQKQCCGGAGASQAAIESSNQQDLSPDYGMLSGTPSMTHPTPLNSVLPASNGCCSSRMQQATHQPLQPTTLYSFPPTCTTIQHPLTPEELAFLQRHPNLFAHAAPQLASGALANGLMASTPWTTSNFVHSCSCGDACNCLGCIAHPYNMRTMNFLQSIQEVVATEPQYDLPCSRRMSAQSQLLPDPSATFPSIDSPWCSTSSTVVEQQPTNGSWFPMQSPPMQARLPAQPSSPMLPFGTSDCHHFPVPRMGTTEPIPQIFAEPGTIGEQGAVSPAGYFHVNYPIGDHGTPNGDCQCGETCTCTGCLTHPGNNTAPCPSSQAPPEPSHRATLGLGMMPCSGETACARRDALQASAVDNWRYQVS